MNNLFRVFSLPFLGSFISAVAYNTDISLNVWHICFRPIHIVIWIIWLYSIEIIVSQKLEDKDRYIPFFVGSTFGIVVGYLVNNGLFVGSVRNTHYILLSGIVGSIMVWIGSRSSNRNEQQNLQISRYWSIIWSSLIIILIMALRLYNILNRNIPNEERSLIIAGIEVHHFVTGLFIVGFSQGIILNYRYQKTLFIGFITILVLGLSMMADQLTYMIMFPFSDDAFFSWFSIFGALLGTCWFVIRLYSVYKRG